MARIGISNATVRDEVGATIYDRAHVRGDGDDVLVQDRTGTTVAVWTAATVTMLAPDLYRVESGGVTYMVERTRGGCGCGR